SAQSVVRLPVTRTDAADRKATERLATLEEPVVEPDVLAEAEDVTGTPAYPEHHFVQHRVVPGGTNLSAEIVHGSTKTRDLVRQAQHDAFVRLEPVVPGVVDEVLTDGRGISDARFLFDEVGGFTLRIDVVAAERVFPALRQRLRDAIAHPQ